VKHAPGVRIAHSLATDARTAVREVHAGLAEPNLALVLFFCSSNYDREALANEMNSLFRGVQVVGCTTAGEFGPAGYLDGSLSVVAFSAADFTAVSGHIDRLHQFQMAEGRELALSLVGKLEDATPDKIGTNTFALLLIDGLSQREEHVARSLQNALGHIPLVGGSAADGKRFQAAEVFSQGSFSTDRAVVLLVNTALPFRIAKTQHFIPTETRLVVTAADEHRVVKEIDGRPAAEGYARLLGVDVRSLCPATFADSPVVVVIDGANYVRSIQKANLDGSLTFFCAIEEGLVLRMVHGVDLVQNLEQAFDEICAAIGTPQLFIGFDCVLRKLEIERRGDTSRVSELLRRNNAVGFNTYGEQFRGLHVNQTLTGIAIGCAPSGENDG
jgi:hypothetical protein